MTASSLSPDTDPDLLAALAATAAPRCDGWNVRMVATRGERISVRRDVVEPPRSWQDVGIMVGVRRGTGLAFAAAGAPDPAALREAFARAAAAADALAPHLLIGADTIARRGLRGEFRSRVARPMPNRFDQRLEPVRAACAALAIDDRIIDRSASLTHERLRQVLIDDAGARICQDIALMIPDQRATARAHGQVQTRSRAGQGNGIGRQGGVEVLDEIGFVERGAELAEQALELTAAPNCPSGPMDLLLMPDQMMLQIHESIGHPLELDRILGDERNFAGGSFVTLDMFGHYQYGSELLNVVFDPMLVGELASYGYDDDGTPARRCRLIEGGRLLRPLGGDLSSARARALGNTFEGVACSRASDWNRPTIDRMANLNIEPGNHSLEQMIASVEHGILMQTNVSWSIDDRRDKFQFGCERGRLIQNGQLGPIVRNPNYRGRSATFWRSLRAVGDEHTFERQGTPYCGKGEPMQVVRVGHAAPACLFGAVQVFGADA
ncbi:MAG: TldD/PmbA family protein [Burkholderiaceae bacterium]